MLTPELYLSVVTRLSAALLQARGVEGLLLDIDGTLKDFTATTFPDESLTWLEEVRTAGIRACLLSNGRTRRIAALAEQLQLPFVAEAKKPSPRGCRRGAELLQLPPNRIAVVGDQIYADVLAGRLAGMHTVLVTPRSRVEPWFTRLKRPWERPWLWLWKSRLDNLESDCGDKARRKAK